MNRHTPITLFQSFAHNLRLWLLLGVAIVITQLSDSLVNPSSWQITIFWTGRILGIVASFIVAEWWIARYFTTQWNEPAWLKPAVLTALLASIPISLIELGLENILPMRSEFDDAFSGDASALLTPLSEFVTVATILVPINFILWLLVDNRGQNTTEELHCEPEFLSKTNGITASEVIALGAEEHYLRVYTPDNSDLIHYRFSDAVQEMPNRLGTRVHRSWWVADRSIISAIRKTRRWQLHLTNTLTVPVSDSYIKIVKERGLLKRDVRPRNPS